MDPATPRRSAAIARPSTENQHELLLKRPHRETPSSTQSAPQPQPKKRYIPGGAGGGGRYLQSDGREEHVGGTGPGGALYTGPKARTAAQNVADSTSVSRPTSRPRPNRSESSRRDKSTRTRIATIRADDQPKMRFGPDATSAAAAVVQSDGYKPREERGWEEFHTDLDIEMPLIAYTAAQIDGIEASPPVTPTEPTSNGINGRYAPNGEPILSDPRPSASVNDEVRSAPGTPSRRQPARPQKAPRDVAAIRAALVRTASNARIAPLEIQSAKEKLTLPRPSFRRTDALIKHEDDQARYVDRAMANVGYQETDIYVRPDDYTIRHSDYAMQDDLERVEYDMDEQDDKWLAAYNEEFRHSQGLGVIGREIFEVSITKVEKEWNALEKRIPKPNPRPPQTHRPRSSSATAVNGEAQVGEEQDSKCALCDDGDCENTNAIVFCDGCDLAVHQECYGVPFIPEGQWLCRKCQFAGRGIPTCIFCPNTDGGFKQTNSSKWSHLLCAMWIPEVSLGNHTFMEPIMDVERVPKARYKLHCYICQQRMGACIQCGNKACYQAFHVTCARRARLYLKMKNSSGQLAVLDGATKLIAFCDKHCSPEHAQQNQTSTAIRHAKRFYKKRFRGSAWASNFEAQNHRLVNAGDKATESQATGARITLSLGSTREGDRAKNVWKLPSGAPIIPAIVYDTLEKSLQRFNVHKRKEYVAAICRYWTLKREARRGAPLIKRLALQLEGFVSMEVTRRNFAGMGPVGRTRIDRRVGFSATTADDVGKIDAINDLVRQREDMKSASAVQEEDIINTAYFPLQNLISPILPEIYRFASTAQNLELHANVSRLDSKYVLRPLLEDVSRDVQQLQYTTATALMEDLNLVFRQSLQATTVKSPDDDELGVSPAKKADSDFRDRKKYIKRVLKAIQPHLEAAFRAEADIYQKSEEASMMRLMSLIDSSLELPSAEFAIKDVATDISMIDVEMFDGAVATSLLMPGTTSTPVLHPDTTDHTVNVVDLSHNSEAEGPDVIMADDTGADPATTVISDTLHDVDNVTTEDVLPVAGRKSPPISSGAILRMEAQGAPSSPNSVSPYNGGVPWYVEDEFDMDGAIISEKPQPEVEAVVVPEREISEELSDMDEETLNDLDAAMNGIAVDEGADMELTETPETPDTAEIVKLPKAKPKRKKRSNRW